MTKRQLIIFRNILMVISIIAMFIFIINIIALYEKPTITPTQTYEKYYEYDIIDGDTIPVDTIIKIINNQ